MNRFDQLIERLWLDELTAEERRELEALSAENPEYARRLERERALMTSLGALDPQRAPEGLAEAVFERLDAEQAEAAPVRTFRAGRRAPRGLDWRAWLIGTLRWSAAVVIVGLIGLEAYWLLGREDRVRRIGQAPAPVIAPTPTEEATGAAEPNTGITLPFQTHARGGDAPPLPSDAYDRMAQQDDQIVLTPPVDDTFSVADEAAMIAGMIEEEDPISTTGGRQTAAPPSLREELAREERQGMAGPARQEGAILSNVIDRIDMERAAGVGVTPPQATSETNALNLAMATASAPEEDEARDRPVFRVLARPGAPAAPAAEPQPSPASETLSTPAIELGQLRRGLELPLPKAASAMDSPPQAAPEPDADKTASASTTGTLTLRERIEALGGRIVLERPYQGHAETREWRIELPVAAIGPFRTVTEGLRILDDPTTEGQTVTLGLIVPQVSTPSEPDSTPRPLLDSPAEND